MTSAKHVLVVGAEGWLGSSLASALEQKGAAVWKTSRRQCNSGDRTQFLDLRRDASDWIPPCRFDAAFLGAAVASLQACRSDPSGSRAVNVDNTVSLARNLMRRGTFVVYPSTNHVFDGLKPLRSELEPVCPVTEYGRQKADAERAILDSGPAAVVRLTKVLGAGRPPIREWTDALARHTPIRPFSDFLMAPIPIQFIVTVFLRVIEEREEGILQVSPSEDVSYAAAASHVARRLGARPELVQSCLAADSEIPLEANPRHTTLDALRLRNRFGLSVPAFAEAIDTVMTG